MSYFLERYLVQTLLVIIATISCCFLYLYFYPSHKELTIAIYGFIITVTGFLLIWSIYKSEETMLNNYKEVVTTAIKEAIIPLQKDIIELDGKIEKLDGKINAIDKTLSNVVTELRTRGVLKKTKY